MRLIRVILLKLILIVSITPVLGQVIPSKKLKFDLISINDGLSQGMVNSILQDRYGFMWFATKDGLNRYDGYKFVIYRHNPAHPQSIADNYIQFLFEDSKGRLWIGTASRGLDLYNRETDTFIHIQHDESNPNSLSGNQITGINEDKLGNIWVSTLSGLNKIVVNDDPLTGTFDFKITLFNSGRFRVFTQKNGEMYIYNMKLLLKIVYDKNNIPIYDTLDIKTIGGPEVSHKKAESSISLIYEDTLTQTTFFIFGNAISKLDQKTNRITQFSNENYHRGIFNYPAFLDESGILWLCEFDLIVQFDTRTGKLTRVLSDDKNLDRILININCIYRDKNGIIWVGTKGYGILKYNPRSEKFKHTGSESYGFLSTAKNGQVFMTKTEGDHLYKFDPESRTFTSKLPDSSIQAKPEFDEKGIIDAGVMDDDGIYWICKQRVIRYDENTKSFKDYRTDKKYNFPVFKDSRNNIWVGSENTFSRLDRETDTFVDYEYPFHVIDMPYKFISAIYEDDSHIFWLATIDGLLRFDPSKISWKQYKNIPSDSTSLSFDLLFTICPDPVEPDKYLWVGTSGGLNRFNKQTGKVNRYSEADGLPNNVIYGILNDEDGYLWMSTNKGISKFDPKTKQFRNFEVKDGLQSNEFNRYSYCKTNNGLLFFGGINGFNYFDPKELQVNPYIPPVLITELRIRNQPVAINVKDSPIKLPMYLTEHISLKYIDNMISFEFASLDFTSPQNNLYRYMLEGFDQKWIQAGTQHSATYTNLNPGLYTFRVQGSNNDGIWNETGAFVNVEILSPWYMTWWFRSGLVLLAAGIIYSIYRFRLKQALKVQEIRNRIARDLHDEIGSTLSSVALFAEVVKRKTQRKQPEVNQMMERISNNIETMMDSMNDIVWAINSSNDNFDNITSRMLSTAAELFEPNEFVLHFDVDEQLNRVTLDMESRKNFYLIFKEAINNISKYAECKNVWIQVKFNKANIEMRIADDGKGFDLNTAIHGNGITSMMKRSEELSGTLKIITKPSEGTSIILDFPAN